ncbi:MAG TPA: hypothetical protein VKX17_27035 [Planctomycetota bacterium]|nr:hypothetical protein [Planctomycetota bacterium]
MIRAGIAIVLGCALFAGSARAAESWGDRHPEARARLLKIFENHKGFREAFTEWTSNHHKVFREMTEFLVKDNERNIEEFVRHREKKDEETIALERIHEKHRDGLAEYRVFVKEHKEAALALVEHEKEIEHLENVARREEK